MSIRVLCVEDSPEDVALMLRSLEWGGLSVSHHLRVETREALREALADGKWDLVLADHALPQLDSITAIATVRELTDDLPVIVVSGVLREEDAVAALKAGAHDFVTKAKLTRLAPAVERELAQAADRRAHRESERARLVAERRLRTHVEAATDIIFVTDSEGVVTSLNPAFESITGFSRKAIVGERFAPLTHPDDLPDLEERFSRVLKGEVLRAVKVRMLKKPAGFVPVEIMANPLLEDGKVIEVMGIARDITDRIEAQKRDAHLIQRLRALRNIDMAITSSIDLRVTLNVLLDEVTVQLGVDAAMVYLLADGSQILEHTAERGLRSLRTAPPPLRVSESIAVDAVLERKTVEISDLGSVRPQLKRLWLIDGEGFVGYHAVPLVAKGQVRGVLEVFHRARVTRDAEWREFLEALATQAAIAIENAAMFGEVYRANAEMTAAYEGTLEGWAATLEMRDFETAGHCQRVVGMTVALARAIGIAQQDILHIRRGAFLHDVGKLAIPDSILLKPGPLSADEREVIEKHPVYAFEALSHIRFLRQALDIPHYHHEKWDGTGYPMRLKGPQIPLSARIFALVDVWDALSHARPYKEAWPKPRCTEFIRSEAGTHFDPELVGPFLKIVDAASA